MLINRRTLKEHVPWIGACLAVGVLAVLWYLALLRGKAWVDRPKGSEGALFLFGLAGGGICLFEFLLWPRKMLRVWRIGRAQTWMRAHIWLGLLAVPLLILHSGFWFANFEATLLLILFLVVVASGVWGLVLQQFLPQRMLDELPAETIYSQIRHVSNLLVEEADRLVLATCGPPENSQMMHIAVVQALQERQAVEGFGAVDHFTVGAVRTVGGVQGKVLETRAGYPRVEGASAIRDFFNETLAVYLKDGKESKSELASATRAASLFSELKMRVPAEAHEAVSALENLAEQRRQFDRQARLHTLLHNWLWVHLPLSVLLIVLMFVHVFKTLQYLWPAS